jgi:NADH dehydrogenase FAD-containing subunit
MNKTDYLIIGGGFAGATLAQRLAKQGIDTLLVDQKDYFEVTYATLRNAAALDSMPTSPRKRYSDFLNSAFVQASVESMAQNHVVLDNGQTIAFEHAIIATGSRYPSLPLAKSNDARSKQAREKELQSIHGELTAAKDVLVIGGGIVGVELAGELAHAHPSAKITLAHNKSTLLDTMKPKAQQLAHQQLTALGVTIKTNSTYVAEDQHYRDTTNGDIAKPDLVLSAIGTLPNSEFMRTNLSAALDDRGYVKVNEQLQVEGFEHIYALGDVADTGSFKLGYIAGMQAEFVAKNIAAQRKNRPLKAYKPMTKLMALIPTGPKTGLVQLPFAVTKAKWLVNMKQKDLFIAKTYSGLETKPDAIDNNELGEAVPT